MEYSKNIAIIGAGVMGGAILGALVKNQPTWNMVVIDNDKKKLNILKAQYGTIETALSLRNSTVIPDVVIIAVKPQSFVDLAKELQGTLSSKTLLVSIMAGQSIGSIKKNLSVGRVVRAMPNLGARFLQSMTVWAGSGLTKQDVSLVKMIFQTIGKELYVKNEDLVDRATAISGSGPGFFSYIVHAYLQEAVALGFSQKDAKALVLQTLQATNTLLQQGDKNPDQIVAQVKSKGGTTEAGLGALIKGQAKILRMTLAAAYKRARALSK